MQDVQSMIFYCHNVYRSYVTEKASGICQLLLDGMETMYSIVKNFVVMVVNTFQIDFSQIFNILGDIKVKIRITLYHEVQMNLILTCVN